MGGGLELGKGSGRGKGPGVNGFGKEWHAGSKKKEVRVEDRGADDGARRPLVLSLSGDMI